MSVHFGMKRTLLSLALIITSFIYSFGQNAKRDGDSKLLTSVTWSVDNEKESETYKFELNGMFKHSFPGSELFVDGKWEWISDTEITLQNTDISIQDFKDKFLQKPTNKTVIRITAISENKLEGVTRHLLDAEDSGFAKKIACSALK